MVVFCSLLYSLPSLWPSFNEWALPHAAPARRPAVHIALMSSVYCTIVMSWERYVRICLVSANLAAAVVTNHFSTVRFRLYVALIVVFPVLFYLPKFFEVSDFLRLFCYFMGFLCVPTL